MKKVYVIPHIDVIGVELEAFIAESPVTDSGHYGNGAYNPTATPTIKITDGNSDDVKTSSTGTTNGSRAKRYTIGE